MIAYDPTTMSVRCCGAEIWLLYVAIWLLGGSKWLLGCEYTVTMVIFTDCFPTETNEPTPISIQYSDAEMYVLLNSC